MVHPQSKLKSQVRPLSSTASFFCQWRLPYHLVQWCLLCSNNHPQVQPPCVGSPVYSLFSWYLRCLPSSTSSSGNPSITVLCPLAFYSHEGLSWVYLQAPQSSLSHFKTIQARFSASMDPCWTVRCSGGRGTKLEHTTTPVHLTDTCRLCLYDSFDAHSLWRINNTYICYQILMDRVSLLWSY
jgi:hypothetical protein